MGKNCRELSKENWEGQGNNEDINLGSFQRIADATEAMAKNYNELIKQRDDLKADYKRHLQRIIEQESSIYHLRGWITRFKKEITQLKNK
jgi:hypothetical protein